MSPSAVQPDRALLEVGALITLAAFGLAGLLGFIAVIDADHVASAFGTGFGVAFIIFLAGSTIVCALACLRRGRAELVALGSILAAGLATNMTVLAIWLEIDSEAYAKVAGVAFVWSFFALVMLGLTLAVGETTTFARRLYLGALVATVGAGLISTWLIATAGGDTSISESSGFYLAPGFVGDDGLLRALGAALVLLAALWFGALAASRLERLDAET